MLITLQHELQQLWRSKAFRLWLLLFWLLASLALWSQNQQIQHYRSTQADVTARQQELWDNQGALNAHTAAHHGMYAFKPWRTLSVWEPGLHPVLGSMVFLEAHRQNTAEGRSLNAQGSRFAPLSLASLFQIFVPLAILVLGYSQISAERENGSLKMLYLHGASRLKLGFAKMTALTLVLYLMVGPVILGGLLLLSRSAELSWPRLGSFLLLYAVYWQIYILLSLSVSSLTHSRQALLLLLGFWALNTLLVPRSALSWQTVWQPLPSRGAFEASIHSELAHLPDWYTRQESIEKRLLKEQGVSDPKSLSVNIEGMVLKASEREESQIYQAHFEQLYGHYARAGNSYQQWGWAFPLIAVQGLSQALSESDFFHHQDFLRAAEDYRQYFVLALNESIAAHPEREAFAYEAQNSLWRQIKDFDYQGLSLRSSLASQSQSLSALLLWSLGISVLFVLSLRHTRIV